MSPTKFCAIDCIFLFNIFRIAYPHKIEIKVMGDELSDQSDGFFGLNYVKWFFAIMMPNKICIICCAGCKTVLGSY